MRPLHLYCPYCTGSLTVSTRTEGPPYLTYETPDEIECDNSECSAAWSPDGTSTRLPWRFSAS